MNAWPTSVRIKPKAYCPPTPVSKLISCCRGSECEEDIDECLAHLCQNQAECVNGINQYQCECRPGFVGTHCEDRKI